MPKSSSLLLHLPAALPPSSLPLLPPLLPLPFPPLPRENKDSRSTDAIAKNASNPCGVGVGEDVGVSVGDTVGSGEGEAIVEVIPSTMTVVFAIFPSLSLRKSIQEPEKVPSPDEGALTLYLISVAFIAANATF